MIYSTTFFIHLYFVFIIKGQGYFSYFFFLVKEDFDLSSSPTLSHPCTGLKVIQLFNQLLLFCGHS